MKKFILSLTLLTLATPVLAAENPKPKCAAEQSVAIVDGMVCDFCAQGLIKVFKKNPAVDAVKINLTTKKVTIDTKPNQSITDAEIGKAVDYSGYKLVKIDRACKKS